MGKNSNRKFTGKHESTSHNESAENAVLLPGGFLLPGFFIISKDNWRQQLDQASLQRVAVSTVWYAPQLIIPVTAETADNIRRFTGSTTQKTAESSIFDSHINTISHRDFVRSY